jgi:heterodisulfide reductase subunit C
MIMDETRTMNNPASNLTFVNEVKAAALVDTRLDFCIQCGSCGGSCPSGADMDHTPRQLIAMLKAGMKDEALKSNTFWYCVSCYFCTVRCPQEIPITDLMYTLKRMAIQEGLYEESSAADAPDFSETFIDFVENYGRSFELGLATRYHLKHHPLNMVKQASLGLDMLRAGRMDLTPTKIKNIKSFKKILAKARELGEEV